jgi:hypothetical protein
MIASTGYEAQASVSKAVEAGQEPCIFLHMKRGSGERIHLDIRDRCWRWVGTAGSFAYQIRADFTYETDKHHVEHEPQQEERVWQEQDDRPDVRHD